MAEGGLVFEAEVILALGGGDGCHFFGMGRGVCWVILMKSISMRGIVRYLEGNLDIECLAFRRLNKRDVVRKIDVGCFFFKSYIEAETNHIGM
jgi:hypothetical protein